MSWLSQLVLRYRSLVQIMMGASAFKFAVVNEQLPFRPLRSYIWMSDNWSELQMGRLSQGDKRSTLTKYVLLPSCNRITSSCYNLVVAYLPGHEGLNQGLKHSCGRCESVLDDLLHCTMCEGQADMSKRVAGNASS